MRPRPFALALTLLPVAPLAAQTKAQSQELVITEVQTVYATMGFEIRTKTLAADHWILIVPEPPNLPGQSVQSVKTTPKTTITTELSPLSRKVRVVDITVEKPRAGASLSITQDIEVVLRSRKLRLLPEGKKASRIEPLSKADRARFTTGRGLIDVDSKPFQEWSARHALRLKPDESALDLVARTLTALRSQFTYRFVPNADKHVGVTCQASSADCAGLSYLLVAVLRSNQIPARALIGRLAEPRLPQAAPQDLAYDRPHVIAEFFVDSIGWIPVDASGAVSYKDLPTSVSIGNDPGNFIVLHVDPDLVLPCPDKEYPAIALQTEPFYWVTGQGVHDATYGPTQWELRKLTVKKK